MEIIWIPLKLLKDSAFSNGAAINLPVMSYLNWPADSIHEI
jgi:hypothetical protein